MSNILRRPMFRGGGKVSSYGNGIASGLASDGRERFFEGGISTAMMEELSGGSNFVSNPSKTSIASRGMDILKSARNKIYGITDLKL
jgi:hypothetical protein